jgi:hypothetical protein
LYGPSFAPRGSNKLRASFLTSKAVSSEKKVNRKGNKISNPYEDVKYVM